MPSTFSSNPGDNRKYQSNSGNSYHNPEVSTPGSLDNRKLSDWFNSVCTYSAFKIKRPFIQDEMACVTLRDSPFNPSQLFSLNDEPEISSVYLGNKGELVFPLPAKVLIIPGGERCEKAMRNKLLPEFQQQWSDPLLFAKGAIKVSNKMKQE